MYGNMQKSPQIRMIAMQDLAKDAFQARNLEKMLISTSSDPPLGIVAMIYPKTIYIYIYIFFFIYRSSQFPKVILTSNKDKFAEHKCLAKVLSRARKPMENLLLPAFTHILKIEGMRKEIPD